MRLCNPFHFWWVKASTHSPRGRRLIGWNGGGVSSKFLNWPLASSMRGGLFDVMRGAPHTHILSAHYWGAEENGEWITFLPAGRWSPSITGAAEPGSQSVSPSGPAGMVVLCLGAHIAIHMVSDVIPVIWNMKACLYHIMCRIKVNTGILRVVIWN